MKAVERIEVDAGRVAGILERIKAALPEDDYRYLRWIFQTLRYLTQLLEKKETTLKQLRKLLFGSRSEKLQKVAGDTKADGPQPGASAPEGENDGETPPASEEAESPAEKGGIGEGGAKKKPKRKGHGRNKADDYTGAEHILVKHEDLKPGDACPVAGCEGTVYIYPPEKIVRITGSAPVGAIVYERERLRCNLCLKVFKAGLPADVGPQKYDATAASMIALLRYGTGMPFNRLEGLEKSFGIPLAASTQWDIVERPVKEILFAYKVLVCEAAQGDVIYVDDTPMKILELMKKGKGDDG